MASLSGGRSGGLRVVSFTHSSTRELSGADSSCPDFRLLLGISGSALCRRFPDFDRTSCLKAAGADLLQDHLREPSAA